ncbi:MAG: response regulator transcription factor, partial [Bacteroidetes bacterium]|nr:response regulator transcription factor [Bacteroidota bacterium]
VREALAHSIRQNCPQIFVSGTGASAEQGRELLKNYEVDIIFLDISMPVENGFDFLNSIDKENYCIIFTTAYEEYALKAIKANAVDYLLKPVNPLELKESVSKAISYLELRLHHPESQQAYSESLGNLSEQMRSGSATVKKITVSEQFGFKVIDVADIKYLEADAQYTIIFLNGPEQIVSSKSIGEFEKILTNPEFFRIHKSVIINLNYLKEYSSFQGNYAVLHDKSKLLISRRRLNEFKEKVKGFSRLVN